MRYKAKKTTPGGRLGLHNSPNRAVRSRIKSYRHFDSLDFRFRLGSACGIPTSTLLNDQ